MPARHAWILLLVFLLSVLVRLPQLGRPLSKNHEFCTAQTLIVMSVWDQRGFFACTGCPAMTFTAPCDVAPLGLAYSFMQRDGVKYYVSELPIAYYAPYALFKLLRVTPSEIPLRVFNLICHLLIAILLYRFLSAAFDVDRVPSIANAPLYASIFYLLMPAPLWYHSNVYISDMIVQLPWAWTLATGARLFREARPPLRRSAWFLLAIAVTSGTEWIGVFIASVFSAYAFYRWWRTRSRGWIVIAWLVMVVMLMVVGCSLWLYSGIAGWKMLYQYFAYRYVDRGVIFGPHEKPLTPFLIANVWNTLSSWGPLVLIVLFVGITVRIGDRSRIRMSRSVLVLTALPAIMHLLVFLRHDGHEFTALKLGFVLCAFGGWSLAKLGNKWPVVASASLVTTCLCGVLLFTWINRPGDGSMTGDKYDLAQKRGSLIARTACTNELIFVSGAAVEPQLMFYAKRNIATTTEEEGRTMAEHWPSSTCDIIWFRFTGYDVEVERIPHPTGAH